MPVVVALRSVKPDSRAPSSTRSLRVASAGSWVAMRFVSPRPDRPACFVAVRLVALRAEESYGPSELIERDPRTRLARTAVIDWCLMYARFGVPGARVERWAGQRVEVRRWWAPGDNLSLALEAGRTGRTRDQLMPTLEARELTQYWADPLNSACVRGSRVPCLKSVGLVADRTLRSEYYWIAKVRRSLLAALMLKDAGRFERFWRSSERADVALEQAYGKPASDVVAEWKRSVFENPVTGPRASAAGLLSSLGWAAGIMALGLFLAGRRQVSS
jgi:hypothetical protein